MKRFVLFVGALAVASSASAEVTMRMPATAGAEAFQEKAAAYGIFNPVEYWDLGSDSKLVVEKNYPQTAKLLQVVEFEKRETSVLKAILAGEYDEQLLSMAERIKAAGRPVQLRICHEYNGDWYPCHAYYSIRDENGVRVDDPANNNPRDFIPAFQRMVELVDGVVGELVTFDLNLNRNSARELGTTDFVQLYPGDRYVDITTISTFNRCGTQPSRVTDYSFADEFAPAYEAVLEFSNQPVGVAETATTSLCGTDKVQWYADLIDSLTTQFPRVQEVNFFFESIVGETASSDSDLKYELPSAEERQQFRDLLPKPVIEKEIDNELIPQRPVARPVPVEKKTQNTVQPTRPKQKSAPAAARPKVRSAGQLAVRPIPRPAVVPSQTQSKLSPESDTWTWEVWADVRTTVGDEPIPEYGTAGTIAQGSLRFSHLDGGAIQSGPSFLIGGVLSDECDDRYWQCQMRAEASYIWRWHPSELGDYNRLQFGVGAGYRYYGDFGGRPNRLNDGDAYGFAGFTWTAGGTFD